MTTRYEEGLHTSYLETYLYVLIWVCVDRVRRAAGAGAVPGAGAADVGQRLRLLPRPRRGPLGTVRLRILTVTVRGPSA